MANIKDIEGVGEVEFVKSRRAKYARITIKSGGVVRVTVPNVMPIEYAKKFVVEKKDWILKHLENQKEKNPSRLFDEKTEYETMLHKLEIYRVESNELKFKISSSRIQILIPKFIDIYKAEIQEFIQKAIVEAWRMEAKDLLPKRTRELAERYQLEFVSVTIRNTKSRWGSCSFQNKINLSSHLMKLPVHLQDYVILHELAHTIHKHHQPAFWQFLDTLTNGRAKELDKELKQYSTRSF